MAQRTSGGTGVLRVRGFQLASGREKQEAICRRIAGLQASPRQERLQEVKGEVRRRGVEDGRGKGYHEVQGKDSAELHRRQGG